MPDLPDFRTGGKEGAAYWQQVATALRARPGEWGLVIRAGSRSWSGHLSGGHVAAIRPKGHWQAKRKSCGDNKFDVWLRYIGPR